MKKMENPVTIVSCFYMVKKSKHPIKEYIVWLTNFLLNITQPLLLFTDETTYSLLFHISRFSSDPSKILLIKKPLKDLRFSSPEWIAKWDATIPLSKYAHLHNNELFRIWANKPYFVEEAIQLNPFNSTSFVWCDSGCWRDARIADQFCPEWPVYQKINNEGRMHILAAKPLDRHFQLIASQPTWAFEELVTQIASVENLETFISGTIFAGDKEAWATWTTLYEKVLNLFIERRIFAGDDQHIHSAVAMWMLVSVPPEKQPILYIGPDMDKYMNVGGIPCGIGWFFLQAALSKQNVPVRIYSFQTTATPPAPAPASPPPPA